MITAISESEANELRKRLSTPAARIDVFVDRDEYQVWVEKVAKFAALRSEKISFGVEEYKRGFEFFELAPEQSYSLMFVGAFTPLELVFFGSDWMIGVSSYPVEEGASSLEFAFRLYGSATLLSDQDRKE